MKRLLLFAVGGVVVLALAAFGWLRWYGSQSLDPRFFDDAVAAFDTAEGEPGRIVFTGSSSIRLWETLAEDMAPWPVLNRGFGGAHCAHLVRHAETLTVPYAPRAIVVYCGDNDLGAGKSAETVQADFEAFLAPVRAALGPVPVLFIAIKPSILRWENYAEIERANARIAALADADPTLHYIDIATPMIGPEGTPQDALFVFDGLHLSAEGYRLWTEVVRPALAAVLSPTAAKP